MLVLSRRLGEALKIGDEIEVSVLGISGNQVRLGIKAPVNVAVDREEIYLRKKNEKQKLSQEQDKGDKTDSNRPPIIVKRKSVRAKQFGVSG